MGQRERNQFGIEEGIARRGLRRPQEDVAGAGIGNADGFKKAWTARGGSVVASVVYEPNQSSYRSELQKILAAKPDVIVTGSYLADTTILMREWYQSGEPAKWILPGWAGSPDLAKAVGAEVLEGVFSVDSTSNITAASFAQYDKAYQQAMGQPGASNVYAAMTWDMVMTLALAIEAAGSIETAAIKAKIREIANPPGTPVFSFAEGKAALKQGKINYEGASSKLDFDEYGDVTPDFAVSVFQKGALVQKYVVAI